MAAAPITGCTVTDPSPRRPPPPVTFREVFEQNAPFVWRCLRRLGVPSGDVEDICQEVFVVVYRKLDHTGPPARAWLYGICLRKVWDYRRLARNRRERLTAEPPEPPVEATQAELVGRREARAVLDEVLAHLDPKQRDVFVLYEIEELPMAEVAEAIGCPLQTAYSRLHAARKGVTEAAARMRARRSA